MVDKELRKEVDLTLMFFKPPPPPKKKHPTNSAKPGNTYGFEIAQCCGKSTGLGPERWVSAPAILSNPQQVT